MEDFKCPKCGKIWESQQLVEMCCRLDEIENSENAYTRFVKRIQRFNME